MTKKIIIGETYLFDVLNETNKAETTTLVTVIKKIKFNKYIVVSVNNGDIFITKKEFLTPYVESEKASVIRCQYGVTDFTQKDVDYFIMVNKLFEIFNEVLNNIKDNEIDNNDYLDIINDFNKMKEWGKEVGEKIQKYVNISNYKELISNISTTRHKMKNRIEKDDMENIEVRPIESENFNKRFNNLVMKYMSNDIEFDEFSEQVTDAIEEDYPLKQLESEGTVALSQLNDIIFEIINTLIETKTFGFLIGVDDDDKFHVKTICISDDSSTLEVVDSLREFIFEIYPDIKSKKVIKPKYRFNIIAVPKRGDEEDNE